MQRHAGFDFRIRQTKAGWRWTTFDGATGKPLMEGAASTRAEAAACVIRSIAERAGTGEKRDPPATAEQRARQ